MTARRYTIANDWTTVSDVDYDYYYTEDPVRIITELATLRDTRTGYEYSDGARRITVRHGNSKRTKTFTGEMAWAEARRWTNDTIDALTRCSR